MSDSEKTKRSAPPTKEGPPEKQTKGDSSFNVPPGGESGMETDDDGNNYLTMVIEPKAPPPGLISHEERPTYGTVFMSDGVNYARRIELDEFDGLVKKIYDHIKDTLCAGFYYESDFDFSLGDFGTVMRYAQQMRLWTIVRTYNPDPPKDAIAYQKDLLIPKAFANILNNMGRCGMNHNTVFFVPFPAKEQYSSSVKVAFNAVRMRYLKLVTLLESQKVIPLDSLASSANGTPFWIFNLARIYGTAQVPDIFEDELKVLSPYADVTPAALRDAVMACRSGRKTRFFEAWNASEDPNPLKSFDINFVCESQRYSNVIEERDKYVRQPY